MIQEKINEIIETLISATNTGNLVWKDTESSLKSSKRNYERKLEAIGQDSTVYSMDIRYSLSNDTWIIEGDPSMFIKSDSLPQGSMIAYSGRFALVKELRNLVKDKFCQDMNPTIEIVENALDSILKGIDISIYRETKITKIINGIK